MYTQDWNWPWELKDFSPFLPPSLSYLTLSTHMEIQKESH